MASGEALSPDEVLLLGHLRRLKRDARDFRIEIFGSFKDKMRVVEIRPAMYLRVALPNLSEAAFEAVD